ncbi:MAG: hypothetical protein ACI9WS_000891 [Paraglaciecola psychrophila]
MHAGGAQPVCVYIFDYVYTHVYIHVYVYVYVYVWGRCSMKAKVGYWLILLSFVPWAGLPVLALLDLTGAEIATISTLLVISAEGIFYLGLLLAGRQAWEKIKTYFPWHKAADGAAEPVSDDVVEPVYSDGLACSDNSHRDLLGEDEEKKQR